MRVTPGGELLGLAIWQSRSPDLIEIRDARGGARTSLPFPNEPASGLSVDGAFLADARGIMRGDSAGQIRLTLVRRGGDTVYSRRFPFALRKIPTAIADSAFDEAVSGIRKSPMERMRRLEEPFRKAQRPTHYPPLQGVTVARDGSVLVSFNDDGLKRDLLVVSPDGRAVGTFALPKNVKPQQFEREQLWAFSYDSEDVGSIVRYKLVAAPR